jgi:hypothetical protein
MAAPFAPDPGPGNAEADDNPAAGCPATCQGEVLLRAVRY